MKYPDDYVNKIICGDCLEIMKGIPDKSIDLVLTDPPLGWRYRPSYENIVILSKSKDNYSFYDDSKSCSNVIEINQKIPQKGDHPTVKPVSLMRKLIEIHSKPNDIILDPFLGSGTTAVACKELGRRFIGIEINPDYCQIAQKRVDNTYEQYELISTDMTTEEDEQPDLIT